KTLILVLSFLPGLLVSALAAQPVILAEKGTARLPIIIAEDAGETTRNAAQELADYLQQMSGAVFEIKTGPAERGIFVGDQRQFPLPAFAKDLEIRNRFDGLEAYVIHPDGQSLYLAGGSERGASHAV